MRWVPYFFRDNITAFAWSEWSYTIVNPLLIADTTKKRKKRDYTQFSSYRV